MSRGRARRAARVRKLTSGSGPLRAQLLRRASTTLTGETQKVLAVRRNSLDEDIRDLSRKIGSGNFSEANVLKLHAALRRRQGDPLPRIIQVALDMEKRNWDWNELVRFAKAVYDDRFIGRTVETTSNTVLESVADDMATFIVDVLNHPEQSRPVFSRTLERLILEHLSATYRNDLRDEIRRHAEGLGGLSLPDLARHVLSRYRTHEEEELAEDPGLLRELALEATEEVATTREAREELADRIVEAVEELRGQEP